MPQPGYLHLETTTPLVSCCSISTVAWSALRRLRDACAYRCASAFVPMGAQTSQVVQPDPVEAFKYEPLVRKQDFHIPIRLLAILPAQQDRQVRVQIREGRIAEDYRCLSYTWVDAMSSFILGSSLDYARDHRIQNFTDILRQMGGRLESLRDCCDAASCC
jgi:hypothetical protein